MRMQCIHEETVPTTQHHFCGPGTIPEDDIEFYADLNCDPDFAKKTELHICEQMSVLWNNCKDSDGDMYVQNQTSFFFFQKVKFLSKDILINLNEK